MNLSIQKLYFYIRVLSLIGVVLAIYLLYEQFTKPAFTPCYINSKVNCDAIISGSVAKTFGIPTPLIGLIGYIVIFIAATIRQKILLISMAAFGLIFCLSIAYIELVQLQVICTVCIACQLLMIAVFSMAVIINRQKTPEELKPI